MKELNGKELQGFIKQRQARQVRNLRQEYGVVPKLVIIMSKNASQAIQTYVRMKTRYAADILIDVDVQAVAQADMMAAIDQANNDPVVQGIILQLPNIVITVGGLCSIYGIRNADTIKGIAALIIGELSSCFCLFL